MSKHKITEYYKKIEKTLRFGGSRNELSIRHDFFNLINTFAEKNNLLLIQELAILGTNGKKVYPDGTLKNSFSFDFGCWESKDLKDDIENEIFNKINNGYPTVNTLFENSKIAILYQNHQEVFRTNIDDIDKLNEVLTKFTAYKPKRIENFEKALEKFKEDIPIIVSDLRCLFDKEKTSNANFLDMLEEFKSAYETELNPKIDNEDIIEILIQHLLTFEIFSSIFNNSTFHNTNNISMEVESLISVVIDARKREELLHTLHAYYETIKEEAGAIVGHNEKQKFLKIFYEEFYKAYNPKSADKLGVVYTPNEIVEFMIESTSYILDKYFKKNIYDRNVNILDPATGTGTFIVDLINSYIPTSCLNYKYKNELFANEVSILPYYIANLNIEYTFHEKMNYHEDFPNICFVDTLDNTHSLSYIGQQSFNIESLSRENSKRIERQNSQKISIIMGNPPYNANQQNFNDFNKNREYPLIDARIKETFVKKSKAQKTKVYDMYSKFYRWSMDRIDENGIISFITNRSFIDASSYDGFRKCIEEDFDYAYIIDTKSDVRKNAKIAGTTHNVFGIQTGVAIMFLVKNKVKQNEKCQIKYYSLSDEMLKHEKLQWLKETKIEDIDFLNIEPNKLNNWVDTVLNDYETLIPLYEKDNHSIFNFSSLGVSTNRDSWVLDYSSQILQSKVKYLSSTYNESIETNKLNETIKWSANLEKTFEKNIKSKYMSRNIIKFEYRPFTCLNYYSEKIFSDRLTQNHYFMFGEDLQNDNVLINFNKRKTDNSTFASNKITDLHFIGDTQNFPRYTYVDNNIKQDNISDWALELFIKHYNDKSITKNEIFAYIYGVLNSNIYKKTYAKNLSQELPRVPFYKVFKTLSHFGAILLDLNTNYENIEPYPIHIVDELIKANNKQKYMIFEDNNKGLLSDSFGSIKPILKSDKNKNAVFIDKQITLENIPNEAWEYKITNRSAIDWVLDQNKNKKVKNEEVNAKFNSYSFSTRRSDIIILIAKICKISKESVRIINLIDEASTL